MMDRDLISIVRPVPRALYEVDHGLKFLECALSEFSTSYQLNLTPDFQRGHVWTESQQVGFIESLIRGGLSSSGLLIQFNYPGWDEREVTGDLPLEMQCIDGLQRLTAIRRFLAGEISAFGLMVDDFNGTSFDIRRYRIRIAVHAFQNKADLLQYYLDINAGGTPHTDHEIERIRGMMTDSSSTKRSLKMP